MTQRHKENSRELKALFQDKEIEIVVSEIDETVYLLQSPANRQRLLQAIEHVNHGTNLVSAEIDDAVWIETR
jgi:antitoxin YefM